MHQKDCPEEDASLMWLGSRIERIRTLDTVVEQFVFSSFSIGSVTWYPEFQITYFAIAFVSNSFKGLNAPHCAFAFRRSTMGQNLDEK